MNKNNVTYESQFYCSNVRRLTSGMKPMLSKWVDKCGSWNAIRWENTLRYSTNVTNHTL